MKDTRPRFSSAYAAGAVTPEQVLAHHAVHFGRARMETDDPPERPDGVTEEEWDDLGDPGKRALVREREARQGAEQRARAAAATPKPAPPKQPEQQQSSGDGKGDRGDQGDLAQQIAAAVKAAIEPLQQQQADWMTARKAEGVRDAVAKAATGRFHDATDALAQVDLTTVVDDHGDADPTKITAALDDLLSRKPHLGVTRGAPIGASPGTLPGGSEADRVKAELAKMQESTGIRLAADA